MLYMRKFMSDASILASTGMNSPSKSYNIKDQDKET